MIISYPFLGDADDQVDETKAQNVTVNINDYECAHGIYPVSFNQRWHGGCHLQPQHTKEPVRAIADGVIVAYRIASDEVTDDNNQKHHNSFVLLKHTTETGEGRSITFYSLYMHLHCLDGDISQPERLKIIEKLRTTTGAATSGAVHDGQTKVYRKDILGYAGGMYGNCFIHFEIFMQDGDFKTYFDAPKTRLGVANPTAHADTETDYWGNSYYLIPQGVMMRATHPYADAHPVAPVHGHHPQAHTNPNALTFARLPGTNSSPARLWVQIRFEKGDKWTTAWNADTGVRISAEDKGVKEGDFEYNLYNRASKLYPACPSAGYELLRFGRILGPDHFPAGTPATAQDNWQPVEFATGQSGYVNLSDPNIIKLSDSDFPVAAGWQKVAEGVTDPARNDGICDIAALQQLIKDADTHHHGETTPAELASWVQKEEVRKKLRRMICQAPTEWDKSINEARFAPLRKAGAKFEQPAQDASYGKFKSFVEKFQFWDQTGGLSNTIWHFHPLEFVAHFKKCGWISTTELALIYPNDYQKMTDAGQLQSARNVLDDATRHRFQALINKIARKYSVSQTMERLSHFFGQGAEETRILTEMVEHKSEAACNSSNGGYGGKLGNDLPGDGFRYRGRGMKQLTGKFNYAEYWVYRGWLSRDSFTAAWWSKSNPVRPIIANPDLLISVDYNAIDAGGWYWEATPNHGTVHKRSSINIYVDVGGVTSAAVSEVTYQINGGRTALNNRTFHTQRIYKILGDAI